MVTKRHAPQAAANATAEVPWTAVHELPRQQMCLAADSACALFRGFEAMRRIQEKAAHQALGHYAGAAEKLKAADDMAQLMAIQAELLRFDLEAGTRYWQQLAAAALDMQGDLMGSLTHGMQNGAPAWPVGGADWMQPLVRGFAPLVNPTGRDGAA